MDKKKKIAIVILALVIAAAAVLGFLFLDSIAAQAICVLTAMILAAVVLALSIEKEALHALVLLAAPFVSAPFLKFFEASELAEWIGGKYNAGAVFACQRMGMEAPKEMGSQTALIITFWIIFALTYLIVWGVRSLLKGKSAANAGGSEADKDFPEKNYQQKRKSFCKFLAKRIDAINEETNWSEETFTPIEAEVEMTDKRRKKRRYEDLHKCLRRHRRKNTVFLVLGDPGSGKSVSMRKLCAEMLEEADKTDLIPVYVDLKKWTEDWSLERLPAEKDLIEFIEQRILREGGTTYTDTFLQTYFRKMLERGKWYFIFDSFDEMPCLMGRRSCQELIDHISSLLHTFLTRENQHGGVIASRLFRAPTDALHATVKLNLQSFSDAKIKRMLNLYTNNSDALVHALFSGREDLVSLCRNPFYLSLLIEYSMNHGAALPGNQMDLYEDFIQSRLSRCEGKIDEMGLKNVRQVRDAARQLALYMQESTQYGLECPASELYRRDDGYDWQKILELLRYAKLCRFGGAFSAVSFVHRRFQECFYVSSIRGNQVHLDPERYSSIEKNNGIRDALVLYSEIAPLEKAREIADHCWSVLQAHKAAAESIRNPGCVELVNTLYFMAEAFRNRREAMAHFQADFQQYTLEMLEAREFPVQHAAVSSMVLFVQPQLLEMVLKVLEKKNRYLSDVDMKNCRTMTQNPWEVAHRMACHIAVRDRRTFMRQFRSMDFSLSMSKQLWYVRLVHGIRFLVALMEQMLLKIFAPVIFAYMILVVGGVDLLLVDVGIITGLISFSCFLRILLLAKCKHPEKIVGEFATIFVLLVIVENATFIGMEMLFVPYLLVNVLYSTVLVGRLLFLKLSMKKILRSLADLFVGLCRILVLLPDVVKKACKLFRRILKGEITKEQLKAFWEERSDVLIPVVGIGTALCLPESWLLPIICVGLIFIGGLCVLFFLYQMLWLRKQLPVTTLDRSVLASNLEEHLESSRFKRRYLENLIERKVKLIGEWPEGERPKMRRDDLERLLAILDCAGIDNLRMEF